MAGAQTGGTGTGAAGAQTSGAGTGAAAAHTAGTAGPRTLWWPALATSPETIMRTATRTNNFSGPGAYRVHFIATLLSSNSVMSFRPTQSTVVCADTSAQKQVPCHEPTETDCKALAFSRFGVVNWDNWPRYCECAMLNRSVVIRFAAILGVGRFHRPWSFLEDLPANIGRWPDSCVRSGSRRQPRRRHAPFGRRPCVRHGACLEKTGKDRPDVSETTAL